MSSHNRNKTHCKRGHKFTLDNVYIIPKTGSRTCRKCRYVSKNNFGVKHHYGMLSIADRDALLASQGGACAICGRTGLHWGKGFMNVWHIDHEHGKEGTHRGVLCGFCNTALGRLEANMDKVLEYLAKHKGF